jgi:hypothetical protein
MSNITVNVTNAGAANVAVSNGSTVNATVGNGGAVNVSLGTISPGNATVVSGTLTINSTTTLAAGTPAYVKNDAGTAYAAKLDIGIPAGPATNVVVGNTTTLAAGSNATVSGVTNGSTLTLAFGIPAGTPGQNGTNGTNGTNGITPTFSASATTLSAGSDATVTATTSNGGSNVALAFGIPAGATGGGSNLTLSDATPSNLGTAAAGTSNLASRADHTHLLPSLSTLGAAAANHGHDYVTSLNNLTGGVTLAAGDNVTLTASGSTLTIASAGLGASDSVDGGDFEGYIPANVITITQQPAAQTASNGAATFSVSATSTPGGTLSYQWQKQDGGFGDYVDVANATAATLSLTGLLNTQDDADRYRVVVSSTNALSVTSASALLTVPANVITITTQPTNQTASGGAAQFTAAATVSPSGTPSYQWQRSNDAGVTFANVSGATSATLALTGLTVEADGDARFRVVVSATNAANVTSNAATLTVEANNTITITQQPTNQTASGGAATFSVAATSSPAGTPAYQWQKADLVPARSAAWVQRALPSSIFYGANAVAYGGGIFAAVGNGSLAATSPDGVTWTQRALPYTAVFYSGIVYGNGVFLAVADANRSAISTDGVTWTPRTQAFTGGWQPTVAYGGGQFVALSNGLISAASTDGINWQTYSAPAFSPDYATYGNGTFVVVGSGESTCLTSTNGTSWTVRTLPVASSWSGIAYGSGLFVVIDKGSGSGSPVYLTSPDGIAWTQRALPVSADWRAVTYGDGAFVIVSSGTPSTTLTSTDGLTWTQRALPIAAGWRAVGFGGGTFVALSNSSTAASASAGIGAFSNVSGATSSSLALSGLAAADNGDQYRAVVSAANAASVTSNAAALTVS